MVWESGDTLVECPRCKKLCVAAFRRPAHRQANVSRISAGAKTTFSHRAEKFYIQGDCPHCGMRNADIQRHYDGRERPIIDHANVVKRLRDSGLPTRIES